MDDLNEEQGLEELSENDLAQTRAFEEKAAKTAPLPRLQAETSTDKQEEDFRFGQSQILRMIAANAPLSQILDRLVTLIEAQAPDMLCSVLLLSDDGDHVRHGAAPSLPADCRALRRP